MEASIPKARRQLVLAARDRNPRETHMLKRGDFLQARQVRRTPACPRFCILLPPDAPPTRLTLARWLVDPKSPTTARVFVNRLWQAYFGIGIVATAEDFGTQCEPPSHPELLDWLAVSSWISGWSIKTLHRLIVTSATYRQSSNVTPELLAKDPYNRLLARGPRFRVDAEIVRDIALAASGLLNPEIGGPSVYAACPDFPVPAAGSYAPKVWVDEHGPGTLSPRALYLPLPLHAVSHAAGFRCAQRRFLLCAPGRARIRRCKR